MSKSTQQQSATSVRMGVPTIRDRVTVIERSAYAAAAALGVRDFESNAKPHCQAITLSAEEVGHILKILNTVSGSAVWLSNLPGELLDQLAPTDDQRASLEALPEVTR